MTNSYQGTPEVAVGVFDSVICAVIPVSIAVTSSEPNAALASVYRLAFCNSCIYSCKIFCCPDGGGFI